MSAVDTTPGEVLNRSEPTLAELEQIIEKGLESFVDVGMALIRIKGGKRYREAGFTTFEDYCQRRWGITRQHGNRLVVAAATVEALGRMLPEVDPETEPTGSVLPTAESQIRPLNRLDSDEGKAEAWSEAVECAESEGRSVTANDVEQAVAKRLPTKTSEGGDSPGGEPVDSGCEAGSEPAPVAPPSVGPDPEDLPEAATETPDEAPGPGSNDRVAPGRPAPGVSDDEADVINDSFNNNVDPGLAYRKRFTDAVSKAHDVTRFDIARSVETAGESADGHRQLVKALAEWCETYLKATRPNHLRSAK